jgi:hypothetical protein
VITSLTRTVDGQPLRLVMTTAGANALIGEDPMPARWAATIKASPPAAPSSVDPTSIRQVFAHALLLGGMDWSAAVDTAERIHRGQLNRSVDFLVADLIVAVAERNAFARKE